MIRFLLLSLNYPSVCFCFNVDSTSVTSTSDEPSADASQQLVGSFTSSFSTDSSFEHSYVFDILLSVIGILLPTVCNLMLLSVQLFLSKMVSFTWEIVLVLVSFFPAKSS